jgi:hypoxanthine phosphoribosyltransferase
MVTNMGETLLKLFDEQEIGATVRRLAAAISRDFDDQEIVLVSVLKGSFMFTSDLAREMKGPVIIDFRRNVVIVEDIIDSGLTLRSIRDMLLARRPRSLKICALVDKRARRAVEIEGDYVGFSIEDGFIVGYGIDYAERYRNLPAIFVVEQEK